MASRFNVDVMQITPFRKWYSTNSMDSNDTFETKMQNYISRYFYSVKHLPDFDSVDLNPTFDHPLLQSYSDAFRKREKMKLAEKMNNTNMSFSSVTSWNLGALNYGDMSVSCMWTPPPPLLHSLQSNHLVHGSAHSLSSLSFDDVRTQPLLPGYEHLVCRNRILVTRESQAHHCRQKATQLLANKCEKEAELFQSIANILEKSGGNSNFGHNLSSPSRSGGSRSSATTSKSFNASVSVNITFPRKVMRHETQLLPQYQTQHSPHYQKEVNGMFYLPDSTSSPSNSSDPSGFLFATDTNQHRIHVWHLPEMTSVLDLEVTTMSGKMTYPVSVSLARSGSATSATSPYRQKAMGPLLLPELVIGARNPHNCVLRVAAFRGGLRGIALDQGGMLVKAVTLQEYGRGYLRHLKCATVDHLGNILVLENKIMRISIFDGVEGTLLSSFVGYELDFPIDFTVDSWQRILVANNICGCVNVYNYAGESLGVVGGLGLTNHCGAVLAMPEGRIVVFDNHTSFNVTVFDQNGYLLDSLCSGKSHAQILSACVVSAKENLVVCSNRDYNLYMFDLTSQQSPASMHVLRTTDMMGIGSGEQSISPGCILSSPREHLHIQASTPLQSMRFASRGDTSSPQWLMDLENMAFSLSPVDMLRNGNSKATRAGQNSRGTPFSAAAAGGRIMFPAIPRGRDLFQ